MLLVLSASEERNIVRVAGSKDGRVEKRRRLT